MTKHTAAPWLINPARNHSIGAKGVPELATVVLKFVSVNQYNANRQLIIASPDLLKALKGMLAMHSCDPSCTQCQDARAAIAKAEEV